MLNVVMAWVGETMTGHGTAQCVCGWAAQERIYGTLALRVLAREGQHQPC